MKAKSDSRRAFIKLRVTPAEKESIAAKAEALGLTVTDFLRQLERGRQHSRGPGLGR